MKQFIQSFLYKYRIYAPPECEESGEGIFSVATRVRQRFFNELSTSVFDIAKYK